MSEFLKSDDIHLVQLPPPLLYILTLLYYSTYIRETFLKAAEAQPRRRMKASVGSARTCMLGRRLQPLHVGLLLLLRWSERLVYYSIEAAVLLL